MIDVQHKINYGHTTLECSYIVIRWNGGRYALQVNGCRCAAKYIVIDGYYNYSSTNNIFPISYLNNGLISKPNNVFLSCTHKTLLISYPSNVPYFVSR